ncbi:hypothetical protein JYU15_02390, partial [bacterium AH-315-I18]|nr:hypothetical protein [bacterium AH-315-I18]
IALIWAIVPTELLQKIASQVAFPVFSRLKVSPKGLSSAQAARVRRPLSILGGMIATLLIVSGDHLIHFLYDARYADAGWMLQLLAIGVWFQMLGNSYSPAILALGKTKWLAAGHLSKFLTLIVAVPLGFYFQGIEGVLWGIAVCELAKYSLFAFVMHRLNLSQIREDIGFTLLISLIVGLCYQLNSSVDWQPITLGIVCVLITLLFWAPFSMLVVRAIQNKKPV